MFVKILLPFFIAVLFFGMIHHAKAFSITADEVMINNEAVVPLVVDDVTVASWQGFQKIATQAQSFKVAPTLSSLIASYVGARDANPVVTYHNYQYKAGLIFDWLLERAADYTTKAEDAQLIIENGKATTFNPGRDGVSVDLRSSTEAIITALEQKQDTVAMVFIHTKPNTPLSATNNLGINELIGHGESKYSGSPANRKHNIAVGVEKETGIIIGQGAVFSFNEHLGPVEAEEGFLPELVIKKDKGTVPELGGGLCQVSSTVFRAAMQAGFPITERRNHSYAVSYYAPQGTDATIYPGVIDLKFVNDSPASILIWPTIGENNTLMFDIYGTKDARQVTLDTPVQYDRKSDGSMKATWERTVIDKDGVSHHDVFKSVYQPPALFHKEEKFVAAAPSDATPHVGGVINEAKPESETTTTTENTPKTEVNTN